jgi:hypothetical protein
MAAFEVRAARTELDLAMAEGDQARADVAAVLLGEAEARAELAAEELREAEADARYLDQHGVERPHPEPEAEAGP